MSFAGTVPSIYQIYSSSVNDYVLKKSLTKILLVTENSPPPLYISSLHLSSVQSRAARESLPLSNRHLICQDPESRVPNAHDSQLISYTSFITWAGIYLSSAPTDVVIDSQLEQGPLFDHRS
jgi:hypothetical protein